MVSSLTNAKSWAESEFSDAQLSDKRRTKRLVKLATDLAHRPSGTLPGAVNDLKDVKAAHKFFSTPEVSYDEMIAPHLYEVFERCIARNTDFIVRASRPRALANADKSIFGAVAKAPVPGALPAPSAGHPPLLFTCLQSAFPVEFSMQNACVSSLLLQTSGRVE